MCTLLFFASCKKQIDVLNTNPVADYFPLQVGNYINYNLDSTLYVNFGQTQIIASYQVQDRVDALITDNLGRPTYRIIRYQRKTDADPWVANNTFMATPSENDLEYVENNLRFIKLHAPVMQDFSWKGNRYINTTGIDPDLRYMDDWDYVYDSVGYPLKINTLQFDSTIKVFERNQFDGDPPSPTSTGYAEKTYSIEKYAKGVGLIYREFLHWEYQPPSSPFPGYTGYGVKLTITGHN
ncbi:MAG: hypothetical protein JSS98_14290 [Bacteroidetes bacterium]|nr:hypothetical protein [Bacteroidota bacterium]